MRRCCGWLTAALIASRCLLSASHNEHECAIDAAGASSCFESTAPRIRISDDQDTSTPPLQQALTELVSLFREVAAANERCAEGAAGFARALARLSDNPQILFAIAADAEQGQSTEARVVSAWPRHFLAGSLHAPLVSRLCGDAAGRVWIDTAVHAAALASADAHGKKDTKRTGASGLPWQCLHAFADSHAKHSVSDGEPPATTHVADVVCAMATSQSRKSKDKLGTTPNSCALESTALERVECQLERGLLPVDSASVAAARARFTPNGSPAARRHRLQSAFTLAVNGLLPLDVDSPAGETPASGAARGLPASDWLQGHVAAAAVADDVNAFAGLRCEEPPTNSQAETVLPCNCTWVLDAARRVGAEMAAPCSPAALYCVQTCAASSTRQLGSSAYGIRARATRVLPPPPSLPAALEPGDNASTPRLPVDWVRREAVRRSYLADWHAYRALAWGHDVLHPLSRRGGRDACRMGLTLVDSLDTLLLVGAWGEFAAARAWVAANLSLGTPEHVDVSLFECNIRVIGGLLAAYHLAGGGPANAPLLDKAEELALAFVAAGAFNTPTGIPYGTVTLPQREWPPASSAPSEGSAASIRDGADRQGPAAFRPSSESTPATAADASQSPEAAAADVDDPAAARDRVGAQDAGPDSEHASSGGAGAFGRQHDSLPLHAVAAPPANATSSAPTLPSSFGVWGPGGNGSNAWNPDWARGASSLAEVGTLSVELLGLAAATGKAAFAELAHTIQRRLVASAPPEGILPVYVDPLTGNWMDVKVGVGGHGDSAYEYQLKAWLALGGWERTAESLQVLADVGADLALQAVADLTAAALQEAGWPRECPPDGTHATPAPLQRAPADTRDAAAAAEAGADTFTRLGGAAHAELCRYRRTAPQPSPAIDRLRASYVPTLLNAAAARTGTMLPPLQAVQPASPTAKRRNKEGTSPPADATPSTSPTVVPWAVPTDLNSGGYMIFGYTRAVCGIAEQLLYIAPSEARRDSSSDGSVEESVDSERPEGSAATRGVEDAVNAAVAQLAVVSPLLQDPPQGLWGAVELAFSAQSPRARAWALRQLALRNVRPLRAPAEDHAGNQTACAVPLSPYGGESAAAVPSAAGSRSPLPQAAPPPQRPILPPRNLKMDHLACFLPGTLALGLMHDVGHPSLVLARERQILAHAVEASVNSSSQHLWGTLEQRGATVASWLSFLASRALLVNKLGAAAGVDGNSSTRSAAVKPTSSHTAADGSVRHATSAEMRGAEPERDRAVGGRHQFRSHAAVRVSVAEAFTALEFIAAASTSTLYAWTEGLVGAFRDAATSAAMGLSRSQTPARLQAKQAAAVREAADGSWGPFLGNAHRASTRVLVSLLHKAGRLPSTDTAEDTEPYLAQPRATAFPKLLSAQAAVDWLVGPGLGLGALADGDGLVDWSGAFGTATPAGAARSAQQSAEYRPPRKRTADDAASSGWHGFCDISTPPEVARAQLLRVARELTRTCVAMATTSPAGIAPEVVTVNAHDVAAEPLSSGTHTQPRLEPNFPAPIDQPAAASPVSSSEGAETSNRDSPEEAGTPLSGTAAAGDQAGVSTAAATSRVLVRVHEIAPAADARHSLLRPETVESLFLLWQLTGSQEYRDAGWALFAAMEAHARVASGGHSSLRDTQLLTPTAGVAAASHAGLTAGEGAAALLPPLWLPTRGRRTHNMSDRLESFVLAETHKYLFLLLSGDGSESGAPLGRLLSRLVCHHSCCERVREACSQHEASSNVDVGANSHESALNLRRWVYNTEAHPLPAPHPQESLSRTMHNSAIRRAAAHRRDSVQARRAGSRPAAA